MSAARTIAPISTACFFATGCAHAEDAAAYEALKRHLAVEASGNWDFYTDGKSTFVTERVRRAQAQLISPLDGEMSGRAEEDGGGSAT